jgi:hypothetical protein
MSIATAVAGQVFRWYGAALGEQASLVVLGDDPGPLRAGQDRLRELSEKWSSYGPRSEIARINAYPGVMLPVSTDTVRLAALLATGGLLVDARHRRVGRLGDAELEPGAAARSLAIELVLDEVVAAGAYSAAIGLGAVSGIRTR